ncbi:hypothetical protein Q7P37_010303 [Cladosporium fusiforme]
MKKILFLCTAHNSLSQSLYLRLSVHYSIDIEYALSDEVMTEAMLLSDPDIIICPFLTRKVPANIFNKVLTLIVHPGPPGDAGPSSLDWMLIGDDGSIANSEQTLRHLESQTPRPGRTHWGVSIIQAIDKLDAGPIWAFETFRVDIDEPGLTKSTLYRGDITRAAITATLAALERISIERATFVNMSDEMKIFAKIKPQPAFAVRSCSGGRPFLGGRVHHRPLLKAASREFDVTRHTSLQISRRIRASDSQPGVLSTVFGPTSDALNVPGERGVKTLVLAIRDDAICIAAADNIGVWITHVRRPKTAEDKALWPKLPAVPVLVQLGIIDLTTMADVLEATPFAAKISENRPAREVWIDFVIDQDRHRNAYLHFEFYNGAMSTVRCTRLKSAMEHIMLEHAKAPISAVVLMGGAFFGNGIALNVIEAADDPVKASCENIEAINDVVKFLLWDFPQQKIMTFSALRGNAAAGGVAMAAACDYAIAKAEVVLNPSYRAMGLHGSEYHTITYYDRCGREVAEHDLQEAVPMSPVTARRLGLIDAAFPGYRKDFDDHVAGYVTQIIRDGHYRTGRWKNLSTIDQDRLRETNYHEMSIMGCDFESTAYNACRTAFVRKLASTSTPLHLATHRRRNDIPIHQVAERFNQEGPAIQSVPSIFSC